MPNYGNPAGPYVPSGNQPYGSPGYANDVYRPTGPYQTGYVQGASAAYGASSAVTSAATGIGSIFTSLTSILAKVLNSIVSIFVKIGKGILGFFGIGKKKNQAAQQQQMQQMQQNQRGNNMPNAPPMTSQMPPPPPGTDINQARQVVEGDLAHVQDPGTAFQNISLHARKATENRRAAEESSRHAEILAQEAAQLAQKIQQSQGRMQPAEFNSTLSELELKKTQALEELKRAEEYTKATYDEALYANLAMDTLVPRFPQVPALAQDSQRAVQEGWQSWTTGVEESQYLFFKKTLPAAPEVFTRAVGTVNAHLNQVDQILSRVSVQR